MTSGMTSWSALFENSRQHKKRHPNFLRIFFFMDDEKRQDFEPGVAVFKCREPPYAKRSGSEKD